MNDDSHEPALASAAPRGTQRQLDYLGEVIRLRLVQEMNVRDTEETDETVRQITYVADSSVFYFYINTFDQKEFRKAVALPKVAKLLSDRMTAEERHRAILLNISTAVITAEYLFSGFLPGQRGFPLYIADEHATEFQKRVSEILGEITETAKELTEERRRALSRRTRGLSQRLSNLSSEVSQGSPDAVRRLRSILDTELPKLVDEFELAEVDRAINLLHLMEDDVARPLRLAPGVDRKSLNRDPDPALVATWKRRLEAYSEGELYLSHGNRNPRDRPLNTIADARVLARIEEINTECKRRRISNRFVLITTSPAMVSASAFRLMEEKLPLSDNFVRSLIQYVPILNFQDMPNFVESHHASDRLRASLDALFQWKRNSDQEDWAHFINGLDIRLRQINKAKQNIDHARDKEILDERQSDVLFALRQDRMDEVFRGVDLDRFDESLCGIGDLWIGMVKNSIGLNAQLLLDHYRRHLGKIAAGLASLQSKTTFREQLGDSYEERQFDLTDRLSRIHLRMAVRLMMANPRSPNKRMTAMVRGARPSLYLSPSDEAAVSGIVDHVVEGRLAEAESSLVEFSERAHLGIAELNLAIATVALRVGLWDNAANFAHGAAINARESAEIQDVEEPEARRVELIAAEADWLAGTARRVSSVHHLRNRDTWTSSASVGLEQARKYQEKAQQQFSRLKDFLGQARSTAEIAMIDIALTILDVERGAPVDEARLAACWNLASEAHILSSGVLSGGHEGHSSVVACRTRLIAEIALVETALLAWLLELPLTKVSEETMDSVLVSAQEDMVAIGPDTFSSWPLFLSLLRATWDTSGETDSLQSRLKELEANANARETTASDLELFLATRCLQRMRDLEELSPAQ